MNLFRTFVFPYLRTLYTFDRLTQRGAFGKEQAVYIDPEIIKTDNNPLKKAMVRHHLKQFHESSCSVASVVNMTNALLDINGMDKNIPVTQMEILDKVKTANWKKRMGPEGDNGKRGLPLSMLGEVIKDTLEIYKIPHRSVTVVQTVKDPETSETLKHELLNHLKEYDTHGRAVIIAHFNQGLFVKALQIPHISPVGAFDQTTGEVTMLDVDFLQKQPYRISFEQFYKGLSDDYNFLFRRVGYGSGGYVYIRL